MHAQTRANRPAEIDCTCGNCRKVFSLLPGTRNWRLKISPTLYCSTTCARRGRQPVARIQRTCRQCGTTINLTANELKERLKYSVSGHVFCGASCKSQYFWPMHYPAMLAGVTIKRQVGWSEEQTQWEQTLHNVGLGEGHAIIPNPTELVVLEMMIRREGRWWDVEINFDDGTFENPNDEVVDDGDF